MRRWILLIMMLVLSPLDYDPHRYACALNSTSEEFEEEVTMPVNPQYSDLKSETYKLVLLDVFEAQIPERYNHLNCTQLDSIRQLICNYSLALVVDGVVPSTITGFLFDIDLKPGAVPVRHQLPRLATGGGEGTVPRQERGRVGTPPCSNRCTKVRMDHQDPCRL